MIFFLKKTTYFLLIFFLISCGGSVPITENPPSSERGLRIEKVSENFLSLTRSSSFKVKLNTNPGKNISITPNLTNVIGSAQIQPTSISLNDNWNDGGVFTVNGVCDTTSANSTFQIDFTVSNDLTGSPYPNKILSTSDTFQDDNESNFEKLNSTTISGEIIEENNVYILANSTSTTEGGGTSTIDVVLCKQPSTTITVTPTSSNTNEGTVSAALTFLTSNWSTTQTVTVTGQNDTVVDENVDYSISFAASGGYDDSIESVSMRNYDDETPQIVTSVTALAGNISETGTQQTFTVALSQEPVTSVVLQLAVDNDEALLNISNLTFTPTTYSTPVTVIVSGVDDNLDDGDQNFVIKISPVSGTGYVNASPVSITGTNTDND